MFKVVKSKFGDEEEIVEENVSECTDRFSDWQAMAETYISVEFPPIPCFPVLQHDERRAHRRA
jgi:hypothetical protein